LNTSKENETRHQYNSSDDETTSTDTSPSHHHGRKASSSSFGSISENEEVEEIKKPNSFLLIPPPYLKPQKTNNKGEINSNKTSDSEPLEKHIDSSGMKPTTSVETKGYAQMWGGAWRVPSTLPDYDDFIARLKSFTGRS